MALHLEDLPELPEGFIPLKSLAIIECLTPEGHRSLAIRSNDEASLWDELGMLHAALAQRSRELLEEWHEGE